MGVAIPIPSGEGQNGSYGMVSPTRRDGGVAIPIPSGEGQNGAYPWAVKQPLPRSQYLYLLVKVRTWHENDGEAIDTTVAIPIPSGEGQNLSKGFYSRQANAVAIPIPSGEGQNGPGNIISGRRNLFVAIPIPSGEGQNNLCD